jgi:replicative DNA helicase
MNNEEVILLHNDNLEITVLGSLVALSQEGNFDDFFKANLSIDLFYTPANAIIFGIISDLIMSSTIPDVITITEKVIKDGITKIEFSDISERTDWKPGQEVNFYEHVRILRELAMRRKTQAVVHYLEKGYKDFTSDIYEVIQNVEKLKEDAETMVSSIFSPFYKGANKNKIRELLAARGHNLSTGYHFGCEELMIPPKALTFIVAATGHCKSTYLINLALRVCATYPEKKVLFLSFEEALESVYVNMLNTYSKVELGENNRNIIANHTIAGGDLDKLPNVSQVEYNDYKHFLENKQAMAEFAEKESEFYQLVEDGRLNIQYVEFAVDTLSSFIMEMRRKGLCDIAFIDYVQLLNAPIRSKYRSREDELKEICISLKNLAVDEEYGLPIVFGAQFNRQVKSAKDLLPTNIGEAGDIERIANTIVALWNCQKTEDPGTDDLRQKIAEYQGTKEYNTSAIFAKILKRRGYASGFTATFPFEGNTGRILDRGDATTKDINVTQQEISFETENDKEYTPF